MKLRVVVCLLFLTAVAQADGYREALRLYEVGDFAEALAAFKRAYVASDDPELLFYIGESQRQLGNRVEAARVYKTYLQKLPSGARAAEVKRTLVSLQPPAKAEDEGEDNDINVVIEGPVANDDKRSRCYATARQAGVELVENAKITAILELGPENRLRLVARNGRVLRDEPRPPWPMEQLCLDAVQTARAAAGGAQAPLRLKARDGVWDSPQNVTLRNDLRVARKQLHRANAQLAFGVIFEIGAVAMISFGVYALASNSDSAEAVGAATFAVGNIALAGPGGLMLGYGRPHYQKARARIDELEELDHVSTPRQPGGPSSSED